MTGRAVGVLIFGALLGLGRVASAEPGDPFEKLGLIRLDAGAKVPEFTLPDLRGESVAVSASGPATVLLFWATW